MNPHPFPHVVFDGVFPEELLAEVNAQWPPPDWPGWITYGGQSHSKSASDLREPIPEAASRLLCHLAILPWGCWLGCPGIVPDLSLWGAGLHEMRAGQRVGPHLDADHQPRLGLARKVSVMLYVHEQWDADWSGELVLGTGRDAVRIQPLPGRMVGFATSDESVHEVRQVACPEGIVRRSLAMFFYSEPGAARRPRALFLDIPSS